MRRAFLIAVLCVGFLGYFSSLHAATIRTAPTNGLVGYWTFDAQNMGTTSARDLSGKGNTGWMIGGNCYIIRR